MSATTPVSPATQEFNKASESNEFDNLPNEIGEYCTRVQSITARVLAENKADKDDATNLFKGCISFTKKMILLEKVMLITKTVIKHLETASIMEKNEKDANQKLEILRKNLTVIQAAHDKCSNNLDYVLSASQKLQWNMLLNSSGEKKQQRRS